MVWMPELPRRAGIGRARTLVPAGGQQLLDHQVGAQVVALEIGFVVAGAHQFDEAHAEGAVAQVVHPLRQLVVVQAAQQHRVELDRRQAQRLRQGQALFDLRQAVMPGDGLEAFALQAVHAHVQRGQAGAVPARQAPRQQRAIGGDGHLADARHRRHGGDDLVQVLAQAGLATGQADLAHAQRGERTHEARDFIHLQEARAAIGLVTVGQAVAATEVAGFGQRQAQVRKAASETVGELAHGWSTLLLHRLACARNGPETLVCWNDCQSTRPSVPWA
ncbi:hypothetical protein PGKDCPLP_03117 [Stenotrophomonas maltophilia]|nr:hypothetical protein PGKDCPLP_03117 [Stenotrophomonas maltophilia]